MAEERERKDELKRAEAGATTAGGGGKASAASSSVGSSAEDATGAPADTEEPKPK